MKGFVQVGQTAMRDPVTGEMLQAVPLYVAADDAEELPEIDLSAIVPALAAKMQTYVEGCSAKGASA